MSRFARPVVVVCLLLACAESRAQLTRSLTSIEMVRGDEIPVGVEIQPSTNFVSIGSCKYIFIDLCDEATNDVPRNLAGNRIASRTIITSS